MGLFKDIKGEWTWSSVRNSFKMHWPDLLAVFIAGFLTPPCLERMEKADSTPMFFLVWIAVLLLASIVIGLAMGIKRKIKV
ncbi:MAG: hypothetical protein K5945_07015 [Bacteroidaceae bacterium]|nr:hypothetical protein [Bacteroidaceae bacterium]